MPNNNGSILTSDIKAEWEEVIQRWLKVLRRLQQCGRAQSGMAIAQLTVVVDANGCPVFWLDPTVRNLEPMRDGGQYFQSLAKWASENNVDMGEILSLLTR